MTKDINSIRKLPLTRNNQELAGLDGFVDFTHLAGDPLTRGILLIKAKLHRIRLLTNNKKAYKATLLRFQKDKGFLASSFDHQSI